MFVCKITVRMHQIWECYMVSTAAFLHTLDNRTVCVCGNEETFSMAAKMYFNGLIKYGAS